jgi:hypothetical protein
MHLEVSSLCLSTLNKRATATILTVIFSEDMKFHNQKSLMSKTEKKNPINKGTREQNKKNG